MSCILVTVVKLSDKNVQVMCKNIPTRECKSGTFSLSFFRLCCIKEIPHRGGVCILDV